MKEVFDGNKINKALAEIIKRANAEHWPPLKLIDTAMTYEGLDRDDKAALIFQIGLNVGVTLTMIQQKAEMPVMTKETDPDLSMFV